MRIISGMKKGCKLIEFMGEDIRPTTDRVKESVFNLIQEYIPDARVLDLFAGSGALCYEAISRGAAMGVCTDISPESVKVILKNRDKLGFDEAVKVYNSGAEDFLKKTKDNFDIVFMDPPYNKGFIVPVIEMIVERNILSDNGIIVVESDNPDAIPEIYGVTAIKQRRYGRTNVTVFAKEKVEV